MLKVVASFCLVISALVAIAQPTFSVSVVSGAPNSILQEAECMNGLGQVAGQYYDPISGNIYAYLLDDRGNFVANLRSVAAANNGFEVNGISDNGLAAGTADMPGIDGGRPYQEAIFFTGGAGQLIGFPGTGNNSEAVAINTAGQIV